MVNAQEWLDQNYPWSERETIEVINISYQNLSGFLVIADFPQLARINCSHNHLNQLKIINCPNLARLDCSNNDLASLMIINCEKLSEIFCSVNQLTNLIIDQPASLIWLELSHNQLVDLKSISQLINLEILEINDNPCQGSLASLASLTKLKTLYVSNTQLTNGLEYLPEDLEEIRCDGELGEILKSYIGNNTNEKFKSWKKDWELKSLQREMNYIERRIQELINLIKGQKEKIVEAYLHFAPEKELLRELIKAHLEYSEARQQKQSSVKLRKKRDNARDDLEEKLGEENMEKIEAILTDCESLIYYEAELQTQINQNQKLLTSDQQATSQIIYNINNLNLTQGNALIGNTFGSQTNLGYQLSEVLESKIVIPLKSST